jgi:DNA-binding NarL/FixJ family response regulator
MEKISSELAIDSPLGNSNQPQGVILIDSSRFLRDCLGYCLNVAGFQSICVDTVSSVSPEQASGASIAMLHSDDPMERLRSDIEGLRNRYQNLGLLVISSQDDLRRIAALLKLGVRGYIPHSSSIRDLLGAIRLVQSGSIYVPAASILSSTRTRPEAEWNGNLTPKQLAIIESVRKGKPNKVIAYELCMCESTVKVHLRNVMRKLKVSNRTELVYKVSEQWD